ncbi:MAG: FAD-binding oxidoreductase [Alphaproteobacteria bacterium]
MREPGTPLGGDALPRDVETAVIGGGVAGISTALFLARAGRDVVVLERAWPWSEASGANACALSIHDKLPEVQPLAELSMQQWARFEPEMGIDVQFVHSGGLRVATSERAAEAMRAYSREQEHAGLELEWLDGNALRVRVPWLGPKVVAATFCAGDAYASAFAAGAGLVHGAARAGVRLVGEAEVKAVRRDGGSYALETAKGALRAKNVVIAAGPWSGALAAALGCPVPLYVDINMGTITEPAPIFMNTSLLHAEGVLSLKQFSNGTVFIGGGWQGRGRFAMGEKFTIGDRLRQNYQLAVEVAPIIGPLRMMRSWAGYEAVSPDAMPVLGALPGSPGAYIATGARGGYSLGPGMGFTIAEKILRGGENSVAIDRFSPARFAGGGHA